MSPLALWLRLLYGFTIEPINCRCTHDQQMSQLIQSETNEIDAAHDMAHLALRGNFQNACIAPIVRYHIKIILVVKGHALGTTEVGDERLYLAFRCDSVDGIVPGH